jgi:uncharacterized protein
MKIHALRLLPGQDLKKEIENFARKHTIQAGWIITCVGSLTQTNLRFANQTDGVVNNGFFEIVSLAGTLSSLACHLHMSISDSSGVTTGGHLLYANLINTTAEIILGESEDLVFTREKDGTTPWAELKITKKK